jgi:hypothetical protein
LSVLFSFQVCGIEQYKLDHAKLHERVSSNRAEVFVGKSTLNVDKFRVKIAVGDERAIVNKCGETSERTKWLDAKQVRLTSCSQSRSKHSLFRA